MLISSLLNNSKITSFNEIVVLVKSKLSFKFSKLPWLDWINLFNNIPLNWLWAWWGCQWASVGPSVSGVYHIKEFSDLYVFSSTVCFRSPSQWIEEFINDSNFFFTDSLFIFITSIKINSEYSIDISIPFCSIQILWSVDNVEFEVKLFSLNSMFRRWMPMELSCIPHWGSLSIIEIVRWIESIWSNWL